MDFLHEIDFGGGYKSVPQPVNHDAIRIDMNFTSVSPSASISSITFKWLGQTAKEIHAYYVAGANGGKGFTEGLPYRIKACQGGIVFNLMLDGANAATMLSCDEVDIPIKIAGKIDQINISSQSVSFWYLFATGVITSADYKQTPYCLSSIPNGTQVVVLLLAEFMVIWQAIDLVNKIIELVSKIAGDLAPPMPGALVADVIIAAAFAIYAYALVNMFVKLAIEIKDNIIQSKKYKLCMRELDMWNKIAGYYKLQFISPIYKPGAIDENATWMPAKIIMPVTGQSILNSFDRPEDESTNSHAYGYPDATIHQFFQDMITKYDGDLTITNNAIYFKNKHDWNVVSAMVLPNTTEIKNTFNEPSPWGTNISELAPTLVIKFQLDDSDPNTKHKYRGTSTRVQINGSPNKSVNYAGWGQAKEVIMPFALAKRKDYLNAVEIMFDKFINACHAIVQAILAPINLLIKIVNKVISIFGGNPTTIGLINNPIPQNPSAGRIGWLEIYNDSFSIPKTFIGMQSGSDWVVHPSSESWCSARGMLDRYYGFGLATRGNQFKLYKNKTMKLCCQDASQLLIYNVFTTPDKGKKGKFTQGFWWMENELLENINYGIRENWSNILTESIIDDETQ